MTYEGLVQYSGLHQDGSTMYVSIDGAHAIDRTAEYKNGTFTFDTDAENDGITGRLSGRCGLRSDRRRRAVPSDR